MWKVDRRQEIGDAHHARVASSIPPELQDSCCTLGSVSYSDKTNEWDELLGRSIEVALANSG